METRASISGAGVESSLAKADVDLLLATADELDHRSFEIVYQHYHRDLTSYAAKQGSSDPEGVADLALLDGYRAFQRNPIRDSSAFQAYLYRATKTHVIGEARRRAPVPAIVDPGRVAEPDFSSSSVDGLLLTEILDDLPHDQRQVILSRFYDGLSAEETGERLGKKANAVHQLQWRAIAAIRRSLIGALVLAVVAVAAWLVFQSRTTIVVDNSPTTRSPAEGSGPSEERTLPTISGGPSDFAGVEESGTISPADRFGTSTDPAMVSADLADTSSSGQPDDGSVDDQTNLGANASATTSDGSEEAEAAIGADNATIDAPVIPPLVSPEPVAPPAGPDNGVDGPADVPTIGTGARLVNSSSGLCLAGGTYQAATQETCVADGRQAWALNTVGGNTVEVVDTTSGHCLDVSYGAAANGSGVGVYACHQGNNQQWQLQNSNGAVALVNPATGRCLDVPNASTTPGTTLIIWDCTNSQTQTWTLSNGSYPTPPPEPEPSPAVGQSLIAGGSGLCLTAGIGGPVTQEMCNASSAQRWEIRGNAVMNVSSGQCLDITDGATANGSAVGIYGCHQGNNQQWQLQNSNGAVALVNPATGRCLDVPNASTSPGTALIIWDCTNSQNQTWTLA